MNYTDNRGQLQQGVNQYVRFDNKVLYDNYQDELVDKTKPDTPVLMMPLRLETRFMKVRKNLLDVAVDASVKVAMADVASLSDKAQTYAIFNHFDSNSSLMAATIINEDINNAFNKIEVISNANFVENEALKKEVAGLEESLNSVLSHLVENTTDPEVLSSVEDMNAQTQDMLANMQSHMENMELNSDWESEVSEEALTIASGISQLIENNDSLIPTISEGGEINSNNFSLFNQNIISIQSSIESLESYTVNDKLAVQKEMNDLDSQMTSVFDVLQMAIDEGQAGVENHKKTLYKTACTLTDSWKSALFTGLERGVFLTEIEDADSLSENDIVELSQNVKDKHDALMILVSTSSTAFNQMVSQGEEWDESLFNNYLNSLVAIEDELASTEPFDETNAHKYLNRALIGLNNQIYDAQQYLRNLPFTDFIRLVEGETVSNVGGFILEGDNISDANGNALRPSEGYGVNTEGFIISIESTDVSTTGEYTLEGVDILDFFGNVISPENGYQLDEEGFIHYSIQEIQSSNSGYSIKKNDILDDQGNVVSVMGGYKVDDIGFIINTSGEVVTITDGYYTEGETIFNSNGNVFGVEGGYSVNVEGFIVSAGELEVITLESGFTDDGGSFFDSSGNAFNKDGGYDVNTDGFIVLINETLISVNNGFSIVGDDILDNENNPLTVGGGYSVNGAGFVIKMNQEVIQIADLNLSMMGVALGASFEWDKIISADVKDISHYSPYFWITELWIRAYPDDIFIHHHEEALTEAEKDAGLAYWNAWWAAAGIKEKELIAWQNLVLRFGEQRAAWIAKTLMPTNYANAVVLNPVQQLITQTTLLQTYTAQLSAVSSQGVQQTAMPNYLNIYNTQVQNMVNASMEMVGAPEQFVDLLSNNVVALKEDFTALTTQLLEASPELEESAFSISSNLDILSDNMQTLNVLGSWAELYTQIPAFPSVTLKDEDWTEQSYTNVLPHRLIFATINEDNPFVSFSNVDSFNHIKIGEAIPEPLYTSIKPDDGSPTSSTTVDETNIGIDKGPAGELVFDASIKWMFDYQEAVNKGMACTIQLTTDEAKYGFKTVLVTGVKTNEGVATWSDEKKVRVKSKGLLEKLLNNHHYANDGMELLKIGTPTNNTDDSDAGFNQEDPYSKDSFNVQVNGPLYGLNSDKLKRKDGQWISDALGVDYNVFFNVKGADKSQTGNAMAMNRSLWDATAGHYMDEMLSRLFTKDNIARTKDYFTDYVFGRGMIPSLRIGEQPYGILPTTSFTRWHNNEVFDIPTFLSNNSAIQTEINNNSTAQNNSAYKTYFASNPNDLDAFNKERFNQRFPKILQILNNLWIEMFDVHGKTIDGINGSTAPERQSDFMNILGADATLSEAHIRFMLNAFDYHPLSYNMDSLVDGVNSLIGNPDFASLLSKFSSTFLSQVPAPIFDSHYLGNNSANVAEAFMRSSRIFSSQQMRDQFFLKTPRVNEFELNENLPLASNYIDWLADSSTTLDDIWNDNQFNTMPARSLLFQLLRQSILVAYRNETWNVLENSSLFNNETRKIIGTTDGIGLQLSNLLNQKILTKWDLVFNNFNFLNDPVNQLDVALFGFKDFSTTGSFNTNSPSPIITPWGDPDIKIGEYLKAKTTGVLDSHKNMDSINQLETAFNHLKGLPTAELDRLLSEHIDLCSYRLDAWNYGMVNKRLLEQRNVNTGLARKDGSYLGAYGWLLDVKPKKSMLNINNNVHPDLKNPSGKLMYDQLNLGFIHTPSMTHAITAALLRSGFVSETIVEDQSFSINLTSERVKRAIELLEGVRNGQTLSELLGYEFERGIHERHNTVSNIQEGISFFRKEFPLVSGQSLTTPILQSENIRPTNVCDGIELLKSFRLEFKNQIQANPAHSIYELHMGSTGINPLTATILHADIIAWVNSLNSSDPFAATISSSTAVSEALIIEIDRIASSMDAVGDIAITEGVYQIAKGNHDRSAAVMESITEGKNMPELEVINTPRTGHRIANRLVGLMDSTGPFTPTYTTFKSTLEPKINKWAEEIIDDYLLPASTSAVSCQATFVVDDSDPDPDNYIWEDVDVTLDDLEINAIELIYLIQNGKYLSELTERVIWAVRKKYSGTDFMATGGVPSAVEINVNLNSGGAIALTSTVGTITFKQLQTVLNSTHNTITNARCLTPDDFVMSSDINLNVAASKFDIINDVKPRVDTLINEFVPVTLPGTITLPLVTGLSVRESIDSWIHVGVSEINTQLRLDSINEILMRCVNLGISSAMPKYVKEDNVVDIAQEVFNQLKVVQSEIVKRYSQLVAIPSGIMEEEELELYQQNVNNLLGGSFLIIPKFTFEYYPDLEELLFRQLDQQKSTPELPVLVHNSQEDLLSHKDVLVDLDARNEIMNDWLYSLARIEKKIDDIETIRMFTDDTDLSKLRPIQMPFIDLSLNPTADDYWIGEEYPDTYELLGDKLSVVLFNSDLVIKPAISTDPFNEYAGLFIHNWDEVIPFKEETTGVTFHYDQPNAKAPQNLLLAVHSGCSDSSLPSANHWQIEDLLFTLLDTLDMSKIRMVEPDHFKEKVGVADTEKFEIFKWMLPAIIGEITPHTIDNSPITKEFQGTVESIQQVSFEYDPQAESLTTKQTANTGPVDSVYGSLNLAETPASVLLQDTNAQNLITQQNLVDAINATIIQLQNSN